MRLLIRGSATVTLLALILWLWGALASSAQDDTALVARLDALADVS